MKPKIEEGKGGVLLWPPLSYGRRWEYPVLQEGDLSLVTTVGRQPPSASPSPLSSRCSGLCGMRFVTWGITRLGDFVLRRSQGCPLRTRPLRPLLGQFSWQCRSPVVEASGGDYSSISGTVSGGGGWGPRVLSLRRNCCSLCFMSRLDTSSFFSSDARQGARSSLPYSSPVC